MSDDTTLPPDPAPDARCQDRIDRLIISILSLVMAFAGFLLLVLLDISTEKLAICGPFLGVIFGWAGATISYYTGSSQGSSSKQDMISRLMDTIRR